MENFVVILHRDIAMSIIAMGAMAAIVGIVAVVTIRAMVIREVRGEGDEQQCVLNGFDDSDDAQHDGRAVDEQEAHEARRSVWVIHVPIPGGDKGSKYLSLSANVCLDCGQDDRHPRRGTNANVICLHCSRCNTLWTSGNARGRGFTRHVLGCPTHFVKRWLLIC